jgi:hypothetical protein
MNRMADNTKKLRLREWDPHRFVGAVAYYSKERTPAFAE